MLSNSKTDCVCFAMSVPAWDWACNHNYPTYSQEHSRRRVRWWRWASLLSINVHLTQKGVCCTFNLRELQVNLSKRVVVYSSSPLCVSLRECMQPLHVFFQAHSRILLAFLFQHCCNLELYHVHVVLSTGQKERDAMETEKWNDR